MNIAVFLKRYPVVIFLSILSSNRISAQSIVDKWNQVIVRQYPADAPANSDVKPYVETDMSTIGAVIYEFKGDKTFVMISTSKLDADDKRTSTGSWSLSDSSLSMSAATGGQSVTSTISFVSGELYIETLHPQSKKTRKIVLIFKKI